MDSNDLEREKGITILAKNTAVTYKGQQINIIDTPGHADFGGEVERGLRLVDGVLLLVDAAEGPLPQTRFVLTKALAHGPEDGAGHQQDRPPGRPRQGGAGPGLLALHRPGRGRRRSSSSRSSTRSPARARPRTALDEPGKTLRAAVRRHPQPHPAPAGRRADATLQLLVANLDYDDYVGRLAVGRVQAGRITPNMPVAVMREGGKVEQGKIVKLYGFQGLKRTEIADAGPGEIVSIAGIEEISIGDTIADPEKPVALPRITVDEPTMMMIFKVNDGPLAGKEGKYVTSRNLRERLYREAYRNVSIRVEDTETPGRLPRGRPRRARSWPSSSRPCAARATSSRPPTRSRSPRRSTACSTSRWS